MLTPQRTVKPNQFNDTQHQQNQQKTPNNQLLQKVKRHRVVSEVPYQMLWRKEEPTTSSSNNNNNFSLEYIQYVIYLAVAKSLHSRFWNNSSSSGSLNVIFCQWIDSTWNKLLTKFHEISFWTAGSEHVLPSWISNWNMKKDLKNSHTNKKKQS